MPVELDFLKAPLWRPEELAKDTLAVAPGLLGSYLVRDMDGEILAGRIVETEAYLAYGDPACHAARGETPRNKPMFGPPGTAYIYRSYGIHWCLNVVSEPVGTSCAVLIRAIEPVCGQAAMKHRRGSADLTNGPGRLCQALGIDAKLNQGLLTERGPLYLLHSLTPHEESIVVSPRIGISQGRELPWRFHLAGNAWVSRHKSGPKH